MACNGNNHGPNCNCGWGGVFYGQGLAFQRSYWQRNESYTNPNAKCPRCSASVYFYQSPYGGKVFFDGMGPPWPKHPCTDSLYSSIASDEHKATPNIFSRLISQRSQPIVALESGWFHTFCSDIKTLDSDPTVTVFYIGDFGGEKQLFSRIPRDQVDILWPILLKRSADRKYYEISTLKVKEVEPSEFRFCAFGSVKDLVNFEINLELEKEKVIPKKILRSVEPLPVAKPTKVRLKITKEAIIGVKESKQKITAEEKEKKLKEELIRRAQNAEKKAKQREELIKKSGINIKNKPKAKLTKNQIRESRKQQQRDQQKEHSLKAIRGPLKTAIEIAFENANANAKKI